MRSRQRDVGVLVALLAIVSCGEQPAPPAVPVPREATPSPPPPAPPPGEVRAEPHALTDADHEARGDRRIRELLQGCKDACPKAFQMQDADEIAIEHRLRSVDANPWADAAEWLKFSEAVARVRAREERMRTDPRFLEAQKKANWVRENPAFKGVELVRTFADPYVIFQEVKWSDERDTRRVVDAATGYVTEEPIDGTLNPAKRMQNAAWAAKGAMFAQRDAILLTELHRRFRELFAERFKLPEPATKGRLFTALVMWNKSSFDKLTTEAGLQAGADLRAFYSPAEQKIFTYIGDESLQERDELRSAGDWVQKESDQTMCWVGTHQLLHEYSAIHRGTPLANGDTQVADCRPLWFDIGLAEFMSAIEVDGGHVESLRDATWAHNRLLLRDVQTARSSRRLAELWTISDFLAPETGGELMSRGERLAPGEGGRTRAVFDCRVWAFCHFLWSYDEGKYRSRFLDYMGLVLAGTESSAKFATDIMKRPNADDWGPVEMEFEWYWREILLRKVGRDVTTKTWFTPSTDPPQGRADDDVDFVEAWDAKHKAAEKR